MSKILFYTFGKNAERLKKLKDRAVINLPCCERSTSSTQAPLRTALSVALKVKDKYSEYLNFQYFSLDCFQQPGK